MGIENSICLIGFICPVDLKERSDYMNIPIYACSNPTKNSTADRCGKIGMLQSMKSDVHDIGDYLTDGRAFTETACDCHFFDGISFIPDLFKQQGQIHDNAFNNASEQIAAAY